MARAKTSIWTRSLDKLRGAFLQAPQPGADASIKKPQSKDGPAKRPTPVPPAQAQAADPAKAQEEKAPAKKIPAQPWYRHRQRW
jgi:hypothetical protein